MNTSDNGHSSLEIDVLYLLKKIWHKKEAGQKLASHNKKTSSSN